MKRVPRLLAATVLAVMLLATSALPTVAGTSQGDQTQSPHILLNGQDVVSDVPAVIQGGRTYLPLRAIAEALGGEVTWDNDTRTAIIVKDGKEIRMTVDQRTYTVDGTPHDMDASPFISGGRTLVPVRYLAEALGVFVEWDQTAFTVALSSTAYGNTPGNIADWDVAAAQGDWIYFESVDYKLYKVRFDGTGLTKLTDTAGASQVNVRGDWIYFTGGGALRKIRINGTDETILAYGAFSFMQVADDWIYYTDMWQKGIGVAFPLYKMSLDGSVKTRLSDLGSQEVNVVGDDIYFYTGDYLRTTVNGGEAVDLKVPHPGIQLIVQDGQMYYWYPHWSGGNEAGGTFYRNLLDGSKEEVIFDTGVVSGKLGFFQIDGDWLYYTLGAREGGILHRHKLGTNETQALTTEPVAWINEVGDYFFCQNSFNGDTIYLLAKDGSKKIILAQKQTTATP